MVGHLMPAFLYWDGNPNNGSIDDNVHKVKSPKSQNLAQSSPVEHPVLDSSSFPPYLDQK